VLAAAALSGASRIFAVGGAGAIAAMAHGTESIPRVDRIVGPGNAYVACAKQLVSSSVGIDAPAGPSELLLIADGTASVDTAALEVLAQAEHDPAASVVVVSTDRDWLENLRAAVQRLAAEQDRAEIITASLNSCGALLQASDVEDALRFAEEFAPEHLLLMGDKIEALADRARNAGTIFVGATSSVTFGDYMTGANHVLPTGGLARSYSGLSTNDFFRWTTVQRVSRDSAARLATDTGVLAIAEGLGAHAAAALQWRNT
jgi:histidinol dehydrogenase